MALQVWDGFDHYNTGTDMKARQNNWVQYQQPATNPSPISFVTGRNGFGKALELSQGLTFTTAVFQQRVASAFVGFACQFIGTGAGAVFGFLDTVANAFQIVVTFDPNNYAVLIYRGGSALVNAGLGVAWNGTLIYAGPNNSWADNVWNFIEMWPVINGSTGSVNVRVNGVTVATVSGVNTQATANAWWDAMGILLWNVAGNPTANFDDLYYADSTSGPGVTPVNTFLGDAKVVTLFANGNDVVQWTPLAATNYQEINEVAMDSDTSYNYTTTVNNQDTFTFQTLAGTITTVYGVQLTYAARKDDAGARTMESIVKIAGTSYAGATFSLPDTVYAYFTDKWILNPNTSLNWTIGDVNGADYGYKMLS